MHAVAPQYDFTTEKADRDRRRAAGPPSSSRVARSTPRSRPRLSPDERASAPRGAPLPGLSDDARGRRSSALDAGPLGGVRTEAARVLDVTERDELRDTEVAAGPGRRLSGQMAGGLDDEERTLAAELIAPLLVPNSSFSAGA